VTIRTIAGQDVGFNDLNPGEVVIRKASLVSLGIVN